MPAYVVTGPDGKRYRVTAPEGATDDEIRAKVSRAAPTDNSRARGVIAGALKPLDNLATWLSNVPVIGPALDSAGQAIGLDSTSQAVRKNERVRQNNTRTMYQMAGNILGTLPTAALPGGAVAQGAVGGALLAGNPNDVKSVARDTVIGGLFGKAGQLAGRHVVAPVAERVGRIALVRRAAEAGARGAQRVTGRNILPVRAPNMDRASRAVPRANAEVEAIRQTLTEARDLGMPMTLADASPKMRDLAGSTTRFSKAARALAEKTMNQRSMDQADRAVQAIDTHLAPITDINKRASGIIEGGRPVYGPLYDEAYAAPPITSPRLEQLLKTPVGRQATARANTIAANELRDPKALGFVLDADGNVVLDPNITIGQADPTRLASEAGAELGLSYSPLRQPGYTTQSLDYVKRGIDDILEAQRNPITGKLQLDEAGRAINARQRDLLDEMDALNPAYGEARAAYRGFAKQASALREGHDLLPRTNVPKREFDDILSRADDTTIPEYQRGYATRMGDVVDNVRLASNPYNAVYGSTAQQQKIAALFPEGAERFGRIYDMEGVMADTRNAILGNSKTQQRNIDDQMFQNDAVAPFVDAGIEALSGGGIPGATNIIGKVARHVVDRKNIGLLGAEQKAEEMAPRLLDPNPQAVLDYLDHVARQRADMEARRRTYQRMGGLLGSSTAIGGVGLLP